MAERVNWSRMDLEELEQFYWDRIAPARERAGYDSTTERPSYSWLAEHGYSGLAYTLREHHDRTVKEFFVDVVELDPDEETFEWGIDAEETLEWLEQFVETRLRRVDEGKRTRSTVLTKRSRLATYARTFEQVHGDADLVEEVQDPANERDAYDRALTVFRRMQQDHGSEASVSRYHEAVEEWYEFLANRRVAEFNPVTGVESKHGLDLSRTSAEKPALSADQIARVYEAAETVEERLVVVALAGWGLRRSEVASLHSSQLRLEEAPYLDFEERKNGAGQVSIIYGEDVLRDRLDQFDDDWSGYLFPSSVSNSGHVTGETINARFQRLCEHAGVTLEGKRPTSHACRRFWYRSYQSAMSNLLEVMQEAAADQGASSADVVVQDYLGESSRREFRHDAMREQLAAVFEV